MKLDFNVLSLMFQKMFCSNVIFRFFLWETRKHLECSLARIL